MNTMQKLLLWPLLFATAAFAQKTKNFFEYENPYEEKTPSTAAPAAPTPQPKPLPVPIPKPQAAPQPQPTSTPQPAVATLPVPHPEPRAPTVTPKPLELKPAIVVLPVLRPEPLPTKTPAAPAPQPVLRPAIIVTPVEKKPVVEEKKSKPETAEAPVVAAPATHGSESEAPVMPAHRTPEPDPKSPLIQRIRFKGEGPAANWWKGISSAPRGMEFGSVPDPNNAAVRRNGVLVTNQKGGRYFFMNTGLRASTLAIANSICKNLAPRGTWKLANDKMKLSLAAFQAERDGLSGGDETMWLEGHSSLQSVLGFADPTDRWVTKQMRNPKTGKLETVRVLTPGLFVASVNYGGGGITNTQSGAAAVQSAYRGKFDLYAKGGGRVFCATGDTAGGY